MYRFGQAATAIGISEGALRNWIAADYVDGVGPREKGEWRYFSAAQIYVLAFTAELVSFGVTVKEAYAAMQSALSKYEGFEWWQLPEKLIVFPSTLEGCKVFDDEDLEVSYDQGGTLWTNWREWSEDYRREFGISLPDSDPLTDKIHDFESRIIVYPHHIVRRTKRALEAAR